MQQQQQQQQSVSAKQTSKRAREHTEAQAREQARRTLAKGHAQQPVALYARAYHYTSMQTCVMHAMQAATAARSGKTEGQQPMASADEAVRVSHPTF
jgi:hypothetical protein